MIRLNNICRYYSDGVPVKALDNVNLTLPSKGMVFVVGKSGSGKSTLLNILAGFDKPTDGEIYIGNQNLRKLSGKKLDNYRNSVIGFVFQDFCLVESFSVRQNIKMAMDFQKRRAKRKKINALLDSVGMHGYGRRLPKQLSAGQKQRVAIARALIKDPRVILADEPTGNLDSKTTIQILDLLKKISENRLVVVVSHSKEDAYKYADRIIEISNGQIISDNVRNKSFENIYSVSNEEIIIPSKGRLSQSQVSEINQKIKETNGNVRLVKSADEFIKNETQNYEESYKIIRKTKMGFRNMLRYSWLFFKNHITSFFLVVIIVTALIVTLSLSIQFANYDGELQYREVLQENNSKVIVLRQNSELAISENSTSSYVVEYDKNNTEKIKKKYKSQTYDLMNYDLPLQYSYLASYRKWITGNSLKRGSITTINSLLVCDKEYLESRFGDYKGNLTILNGEIKENGDGIIITDYAADMIIKYYFANGIISYQNIIDTNYLYSHFGVKINAIISTNYKEEYAHLLKDLESLDAPTPELTNLIDLLVYHYGIAYTINPKYYSNYVEKVRTLNLSRINVGDVLVENGDESSSSSSQHIAYFYKSLKDDEVILNYTFYNQLFGTNCSSYDMSEFESRNVTIKFLDENKESYIEKVFKVVDLDSYSGYSRQVYNEVIDHAFKQGGIYVRDNKKDLAEIVSFSEEIGMYVADSKVAIIRLAIQIVAVFNDIFKLLVYILIAAIIALVVINSINTLNRNIYNIGICRAMGAHMSELTFIYAFQMLAFGAFVISFSLIGDYLSANFVNELITHNIVKIIERPGITDITFVFFNPAITSICTGLIEFLTINSIIIPIIAIRLMNPVNIIKSRDK